MIPGRQYAPADVLRMVQRRVVVMLGVFLGLAAVVVGIVQRLPNSYRSEAVILVTSQRVPEDLIPATVTTRVDDQLRRLTQQLVSRTTLEGVIAEFGLYPLTADGRVSEESVEEMRSDVGLDVVKGDAFRVFYISRDPVTSWHVTERLAEILVAAHTKQRTDFAVDINSFLETQLAEVRAKLAQQERRIDEYRRKHVGELPGQLQPTILALAAASAKTQALSDSVERDRDRLDALQRSPSAVPQSAAESDPVFPQLAAARGTLSDLEGRLTKEHPDVVRQRRIVADLQTAASRAANTPAPPPTGSAPADSFDEARSLRERIAAKEAEQARLLASVTRLQARIDAPPAQEAGFSALTRDYATLQKLYGDLLTKENESQIAASLERRQVDQQFRLLDPARLPDRPFGPNRLRLLLLGVLGALGAAAVIGGIVEARDQRIHDVEDLAGAIDLPVFAVISEIATGQQLALRRRATVGGLVAAMVVVCLVFAWWSVR